MSQFNGYYGCSFCLIRGVYDADIHRMLYPFNDSPQHRNEQSYLAHVRESEESGKTCFGVKGSSPLSHLISLPMVPFDCMHLLYLGVVRSIILHSISKRFVNEETISNILTNSGVPASFKRKPISFQYKIKFKASEWKQLILYFHCIFYVSDCEYLKLIITLLSSVIHILNRITVSSTDCDSAATLIDILRDFALRLFGPSVQSFSMHALQHLPSQVKHYGALWSSSASIFESSFHHLKASHDWYAQRGWSHCQTLSSQ